MSLALTCGGLAVVLDHLGLPDVAATVYGAVSRAHHDPSVPKLAETIEHLCRVLGPAAFDRRVATGAAMETDDAVAYARQQLRLARQTVVAARDA